MTEENHCYENGKAERLNGVLKQEYGLGEQFATRSEARRAIGQAVILYDNYRPHGSLGYRTPMGVHAEAGIGSSARRGPAPDPPKGKRGKKAAMIGVGN